MRIEISNIFSIETEIKVLSGWGC